MADRFPGCIRIGGQLSRNARLYPDDPDEPATILQGLVSVLEEDNASREYGDTTIPEGCSEANLLNWYLDEGVLVFKNAEARNGEFEHTEEFCVQHDIPFGRWSDHYCEYDAEKVHFRPGMNAPVTTYADSNGKEVVCGDTVRQAIEKLDKFEQVAGKATAFQVEDFKNLVSAIRILHDACPDLPDPLPKFEMVA